MSKIRKVTLGSDGNYPKATQRTGKTKSTRRVGHRKTSGSSSPTQSTPRDTFQRGHHDADMAQMDKLRKQASSRRPSFDVSENYPKAGSRKSTPKARAKAGNASSSSPKRATTSRRPVQANGNGSSGSAPSSRPVQTVEVPQASPRPTGELDLAPSYPQSGGAKPQKFVGKYKHELAIIEAKQRKQAAFDADLEASRKNPAPEVEAPKTSTKQIKTNKKMALGGGFKVASGVISMKNGVENLSNGNYVEGGLQMAQGGVSTAEGISDINAARQGFSAAPKTAFTKGLSKAGGFLNAGMAIYDTKQAYDAIKGGNEVKASEEMGSAVINAVSAFPPTALIGAVGGVADWAMAASGADDAMVRALTSGKTKAYNKQMKRDVQMGRMLMNTSTGRLKRSNREEKKKYIRGLNGLKELRKLYMEKGDMESVRRLDAHTQRIRGAWAS